MKTPSVIRKIGLVCTHDADILLVRKRNTARFILPGGKPDHSETDVECLTRELGEELGVELTLDSLALLGTFVGPSANESARLELVVYTGEIIGAPEPKSEIEEMRWVNLWADLEAFSPLLKTEVIPRLRERASKVQRGN